MMPTPSVRGSLLLALILCGCATVQRSREEIVRDAVVHGRYDEAVREADALRRQHPGDPRIEVLHRDATVAWLLARGREETFQDRDSEALETFRQALELDPKSRETAAWIDKTLRKLSRTYLERGLELHASGKLAEAVAAYEKALEYVPGDPSALNGLGEAVIQINYRQGMGKDYFQQGLKALSEYWLEQARSRFTYSKKYEPDDPKTHQRRSQVDELLAQQRVTVAKGMEEDRRFAAARYEYGLAHALDPENEEARAGLERSRKEAKALDLLSQARMEIVRGRIDRALSLVQEGEELTTAQKDLFEGARDQIEQRGFEGMYQDALALERDLEYELAVEKYGALLRVAEYYKDALARKETLEEYIRLAAQLYAEAQAAASDQGKIDALRKLSVFWPEYKDVAEQLRGLMKSP